MARMATITKEELAERAGVYFLSSDEPDIPVKLWIDTAVNLEQSYLRAAWEGLPSKSSMIRLAALGEDLDERYGTDLVCVAYEGDRDWAEIEARSRDLRRVR